MRDRMTHSYFQIDIDVIFDALKNDILPLLEVMRQMKSELS
jgi:uncharacterized protein with HEPN domain